MIRIARVPAAAIALLCIACTSQEAAPGVDSSRLAKTPEGTPFAYERIALDTSRPPGTIVDSVFPMPEMIRRFRAGLTDPRGLVGGAPSRQALIEQFVAALAAGDRTRLGTLTLSRAEFAYVYYPNSPDALRENGMPPALRWDLMTLNSEKGIGRTLERIGAKPLQLTSFDCPNPPVTTGTVTEHGGCVVQLGSSAGTTFSGRLFGSIVEHRGRFKFAGYANDM
jgi:hypothetical protein